VGWWLQKVGLKRVGPLVDDLLKKAQEDAANEEMATISTSTMSVALQVTNRMLHTENIPSR
jgi:hypothetical protein